MESIMEGVQLFQKGGFVMYVLLACSVFILYIAVERHLYYRRMDDGKVFAETFYMFMESEQYEEALHLVKKSRGGLAKILAGAAERDKKDRNVFIEVQSGILLATFRHHLYYLNVIVTMAPLLGLLGTISGMMTSFSIFYVESRQTTAITGGIGEALIATAFGLCVAILSLSVHAYFTQRLERIITDMEMCFSVLEFMPDEKRMG